MKRVELTLTETERQLLEALSSQGVSRVRELTRAQILLALDRGIADQTISSCSESRENSDLASA